MSGGGGMIEVALPDALQPINTLHRWIVLAGIVSTVETEMAADEASPGPPGDPDWTGPRFEEIADLADLRPEKRREINAIQRTADLANGEGLRVVYVDALAYQGNGIDLIACSPDGARTVVFEVKATSRPPSRHLRSYLRSTRHKGRQLTRRWCRESAFELALLGASARSFFYLVRPMAEGRLERRLCVWPAEDHAAELPPSTLLPMVWDEAALCADPEFDDDAWSDLGAQLTEILEHQPDCLDVWSGGLVR